MKNKQHEESKIFTLILVFSLYHYTRTHGHGHMDIINRTILQQKDLTYKYRSDPDIPIGVLGMVDDNLCISECGITSVQKNAITRAL